MAAVLVPPRHLQQTTPTPSTTWPSYAPFPTDPPTTTIQPSMSASPTNSPTVSLAPSSSAMPTDECVKFQLVYFDNALRLDEGYSHWSVVDSTGGEVWTDVSIWFQWDDDQEEAEADSVADSSTTWTVHNICLPTGLYTLDSVANAPYVLLYRDEKMHCDFGRDYNFTLPFDVDENSGCTSVDDSVDAEFVALQCYFSVSEAADGADTADCGSILQDACDFASNQNKPLGFNNETRTSNITSFCNTYLGIEAATDATGVVATNDSDSNEITEINDVDLDASTADNQDTVAEVDDDTTNSEEGDDLDAAASDSQDTTAEEYDITNDDEEDTSANDNDEASSNHESVKDDESVSNSKDRLVVSKHLAYLLVVTVVWLEVHYVFI